MLKRLLIIGTLIAILIFSAAAQGNLSEKQSPQDYISEDNIHIYDDKVVIEVPHPMWARFSDTNSMDPVIDIGANSIELKPQSPDNIHQGDIISYYSSFDDSIIIHRVIDIKEDKDGVYYITKGDNNAFRDPERVRFEQVHGIVIGILY